MKGSALGLILKVSVFGTRKWSIMHKSIPAASIRPKLKCFGHLKRSEGLRKNILPGKINGKRETGRPRGQWELDARNIFDMSATEVGRLAIDRNC